MLNKLSLRLGKNALGILLWSSQTGDLLLDLFWTLLISMKGKLGSQRKISSIFIKIIQMKQKCVEHSWNKLESAIGPGLHRANSHRISKRSINSGRIPTSRCASSSFRNTIEIISTSNLKKLYKAKCQDMEIPVLPDQESRFLTFCSTNFKNRQFHMKESGLGLNSAMAIGKVLKSSNFAFINLYKNSFGNKGTYAFLKEISDSQTIVHLNLSNNELSPEGFEKIGKILTYHPSIASLDISSYEGLHRNRISSAGASFLQPLLRQNSILQFLSISGTCLSDGIEFVSLGLSQNKTLVFLDLSNNSLTGRHMENFSKAVVKSDLKKLNLSQNNISDDGCEYLANMLIGAYEAGCPLVNLNLSTNGITSKGAGNLFSSLRLNCMIKEFNASGNNFFSGLSQYFPSFLADNCVLTTLNLSDCRLRPESLTNVSEGLSKNKKLENLFLNNNKLLDNGIEQISLGLSKNEALLNIDLSSCQIKGQGAMTLVNCLRSNFTLRYLNLKDNSVKDQAGELFCDLTRVNKNFLSINLDLNPLNLKFVALIKANLKENLKAHKKALVPKIKSEIQKMKIPLETYETINEHIRVRLEEKFNAEQRFEIQTDNFEEIKEREEKKTKAMIEELKVLKEKNLELSKVIEGNKTDVVVMFM